MPPNRTSALIYLKSVAGEADDSFFSIRDEKEELPWEFEGVELTVVKKSYSQARPTNIHYEIYLGTLLPLRKDGSEDCLTAYVLNPKSKEVEGGIAANQAAYKLCLDRLARNPLSWTEEVNA